MRKSIPCDDVIIRFTISANVSISSWNICKHVVKCMQTCDFKMNFKRPNYALISSGCHSLWRVQAEQRQARHDTIVDIIMQFDRSVDPAPPNHNLNQCWFTINWSSSAAMTPGKYQSSWTHLNTCPPKPSRFEISWALVLWPFYCSVIKAWDRLTSIPYFPNDVDWLYVL